MLVTAAVPDGRKVVLGVSENTLIFDGTSFVTPSDARWVELYGVPVNALSVSYKDVLPKALVSEVRILALITNIDPTAATTDPLLVSAVDPSNGDCICGVTCNGTDIRFAHVQYLEN